jgi:diguanylate cyclase (GGDEF)-like protein
MKTEENLATQLSLRKNLPTLPGIAIKIIEVIQKDDFDLKELSDIVTKDPPLSAQVLKTINSPFYGLPRKITSVFHAVNLLGATTVKNLALSFTLLKTFDDAIETQFRQDQFWKNSLTAAIACQCIAKKLFPQAASDAFTLGLIHDIGFLALTQMLPDQYNLVSQENNISEIESWDFHEKETQVFGFNHMDAGSYLLKSWGLPESFYLPIGHHHNPDDMDSKDPLTCKLTRILHLSSIFIDAFNSADPTMAFKLLGFYSNRYGFSEQVDLFEIADEIKDAIKEIFPIFELRIEDEKVYTDIIASARTALIDVSMDFMNALIEQKRRIDELTQYVTLDGMTGLLNYQEFYKHLHKELSRAYRYDNQLTLIFGDIDDFKSINDTYGHLAGDMVIQEIAACLKSAVREADSIARYGGEEFAIVLPETPLKSAYIVVERLRDMVNSLNILYYESTINVTMSFGVASISVDESITKEEMVKRADEALYRAKNSGKNCCCVFVDGSVHPITLAN